MDIVSVGCDVNPQQGEISLSHNSFLFLDEFPEFGKKILEDIQHLEERRITVTRAKIPVDFQANFILIDSMNPCPCDINIIQQNLVISQIVLIKNT